MSARAGVWLLITVAVVLTEAAPDSSSTWMRSQPQQTLHGQLVSIDERLQAIENTRWEVTLKQVEQRVDAVESSIRRLDSTFQDRLDKLERNLNSKELKDELTVEKLSHKIRDILDSTYDRYNCRLGYTEERLEMTLKKIQMNMEASLNRIEKQQEDVQNEVLESVALLEDLKSQTTTTEDKLNNTHKVIQQHIQRLISPSHEEFQKISGSLDHISSRLNGSLVPTTWSSQNDGPPSPDVLTSLRKEINTEGTKITNKINNMYNDLWRRVISVETLIRDISRATNITQRDFLEEIRSLLQPDHRDFPGDSQENFLEVALDALEHKLHRKLLDLGRKVDDRLDTLSATQNLVMDSCFDGGICHGLESRLSLVLEKIFDVFSGKIEGFSNRTLELDSMMMEMMELAKLQHRQLTRTVTHNTNMVVTLAKDSSETSKLLHHTVTQLAEKSEYNFQELHDELQEISNMSGKICIDSEKPEEIISQHITADIPQKNNTNDQAGEFSTMLSNTTQSKNNTVKHYDTGVLKITTDDVNPMADNSSLPSSTVKSIIPEETYPLAVDSSIFQVIELMTYNLTQHQKDSLMRFLNSTISVDNLEAIIQNTEAETEDYTGDRSVEIYDAETLNRTGNDEEISSRGKGSTVTESSYVYGELENPSEENNNDLIQNETTTIEVVAIVNSTGSFGGNTEVNINNRNETKPLEMPPDLKELLKAYSLVMKIKQGNLNIKEFWKPLQKQSNGTDDQKQHNFISPLQKLCYGEENIQSFASDHNNSKMRDKLLHINQIINDKNLYEKIENICNTMTESLIIHETNKLIPAPL